MHLHSVKESHATPVFPASHISALYNVSDPSELFQYSLTRGYPSLLNQLSAVFAVPETQVQIVNGLDHALTLLLLVTLDPEDAVAIDAGHPHYAQVCYWAHRLKARVVPLPAHTHDLNKGIACLVFDDAHREQIYTITRLAASLNQTLCIQTFHNTEEDSARALKKPAAFSGTGYVAVRELNRPEFALAALIADEALIARTERVAAYMMIHSPLIAQQLTEHWLNGAVFPEIKILATRTTVLNRPLEDHLSRLGKTLAPSPIREIMKLTRNTPATNLPVISLGGGYPSPATFPTQAFKNGLLALADRGVKTARSKAGQINLITAFLNRLKEEGFSNWTDDKVMITNGSQEALGLIVGILARSTDTVLAVDEITYAAFNGILDIFNKHDAVVRIPRNGGNMDIQGLEDQLKAGTRIHYIYVIPDAHNPLGASMSVSDRIHLIKLARVYDFTIIEDAPYRNLELSDPEDGQGPLPYIKQFDSETEPRVILLKSLSKELSPALRLAAVYGPEHLIQALIKERDYFSRLSPLSQELGAHFLANNSMTHHLQQSRAIYKPQREAMMASLDTYFSGFAFTRPTSGFFVFLEVAPTVNCRDFFRFAFDQYGVIFIPGSAFGAPENTLRLSYAQPEPDKIWEGVKRLREAYDVFHSL